MKKLIVFDIDGTLANLEHRRFYVTTKPKNWKAFVATMHLDTVHDHIAWMFRIFKNDPDCVVICSTGRSEDQRGGTITWQNDNDLVPHEMFMRKSGDYRADNIVKEEMLAEIRVKYGEPYIWFDDRQQVVDMLRRNGVNTIQVADGDF